MGPFLLSPLALVPPTPRVEALLLLRDDDAAFAMRGADSKAFKGEHQGHDDHQREVNAAKQTVRIVEKAAYIYTEQ